MTTSRTSIELFSKSITSEIFDLLWFADGPFKNYQETVKHEFVYENIVFRFEMFNSEEPSVIYSNLPIQKEFSGQFECPSYYPSYKGLTPSQRIVYLKWLTNPYSEIDIGYVFIFYYGLERHLLLGNFEKAFDVIIKLRAFHKNKSFLTYSMNALILSAIFQKRPDKLKLFFDTLNSNYITGSIIVYLLGKTLFQMSLNADDIILLGPVIGFTNKRYINQERALFIETINNALINVYGKPEMDLTFLKTSTPPFTNVNFLANYSIPGEQRYLKIPDFTQVKDFNNSIYSLLATTHETIKKLVRKRRQEK